MTPVLPDNDNIVPEEDLQAYVDGQLNAGRRAAIEAYLAARPGEAARLAAYRAQNIGLHALFDPRPGSGSDGDGRIPPRLAALVGALEAHLNDGATRVGARTRRLWHFAASVALLLTAGTAGWITLAQHGWHHDSLVAFTRQATEAPLQADAIAQSGGVQKTQRQVVAWLAEQPGNIPAHVPDLESLGFRLADEHMLASAGGPSAAQLLYQDDAGQRLTLTMRAGGKAGQTSFTFTRDGDASRFGWQDAHMTYSLVGSMAQEKLLEIAEAVSASLQENAAPVAAPETVKAPDTAAVSDTPPAAKSATAPPDAQAPSGGAEPAIENSPLIPVPLPEGPDQPKET